MVAACRLIRVAFRPSGAGALVIGCVGSLVLQPVESSRARDQTHVLCTSRQILIHRTRGKSCALTLWRLLTACKELTQHLVMLRGDGHAGSRAPVLLWALPAAAALWALPVSDFCTHVRTGQSCETQRRHRMQEEALDSRG